MRGTLIEGTMSRPRNVDAKSQPNAQAGSASGGQSQHVVIGRAIVKEPKAFLLDEPLSNLDAELRVKMRGELVALHRRLGSTVV